jgi:hypothetical protein
VATSSSISSSSSKIGAELPHTKRSQRGIENYLNFFIISIHHSAGKNFLFIFLVTKLRYVVHLQIIICIQKDLT